MHSSSTFLMGKFLCHCEDNHSMYGSLTGTMLRPRIARSNRRDPLHTRWSSGHPPTTARPPQTLTLFTPPLREFYYSNEFMKILKATINRHTSLPTAQQTTSHHCQLVRPHPGHPARYAWIVSSRCSLLRCSRLIII